MIYECPTCKVVYPSIWTVLGCENSHKARPESDYERGRREALEQAAKLADEHEEGPSAGPAIRALMSRPPAG